MAVRQTVRSGLYLVAGLAVGVCLMGSFAGKGVTDSSAPVPKSSETVFGGVRFVLSDVNDRDWPLVKRDLTIYRNGSRIIDLRMNDQGVITDCRLWDGQNMFLDALFGEDRIAGFGFYNSAGTIAMFTGGDASAWSGIWHAKTVREYGSDGRWLRGRPVGEAYIDIDCDGQFDVKSIYNDKSEITSQWVFMEGRWQMLGVFDPPVYWTKASLWNDQHATLLEDGKKHTLDFTPGLGWKRRQSESKSEK